MFIICAFVTENTPYEQVAKDYLIPSLKKLNIPYDLQVVPNRGSWQANTSYKASFAREMLEKHADKDIVLLDADSRVMEYPEIFDNIPLEYHFGAFTLDRNTHYGYEYPEDARYEFLSGSLFIRNTPIAYLAVRKWKELCQSSSEWEQKILERVLKTSHINIFNLPMSYCYITSLPDGEEPKTICKEPVICHYQISRTLKKRVDNK